MEIMI